MTFTVEAEANNKADQSHAHVTRVIKAPLEQVYAVFTDYNEGHAAILPKHIFTA